MVAIEEAPGDIHPLTARPFQPKLRLSKHMYGRTQRIRVLALLLGVIFLGAQFHFCTDLTPTSSASHICPLCSAAGSLVAARSPNITLVPIANRLELAPLIVSVSASVSRAVSPRAPPSV